MYESLLQKKSSNYMEDVFDFRLNLFQYFEFMNEVFVFFAYYHFVIAF